MMVAARCGAVGSALALGARSRRFKSCPHDQIMSKKDINREQACAGSLSIHKRFNTLLEKVLREDIYE